MDEYFYREKPVRWHDLSAAQQDSFGNGCGAKWMPKWMVKSLFNFFFEASCRRHDFAYSRGGSEQDRKKADDGFYAAMLRDCDRLSGLTRMAAEAKARIFYSLVRAFGWMQFTYGRYRPLSEIMGGWVDDYEAN